MYEHIDHTSPLNTRVTVGLTASSEDTQETPSRIPGDTLQAPRRHPGFDKILVCFREGVRIEKFSPGGHQA